MVLSSVNPAMIRELLQMSIVRTRVSQSLSRMIGFEQGNRVPDSNATCWRNPFHFIRSFWRVSIRPPMIRCPGTPGNAPITRSCVEPAPVKRYREMRFISPLCACQTSSSACQRVPAAVHGNLSGKAVVIVDSFILGTAGKRVRFVVNGNRWFPEFTPDLVGNQSDFPDIF